MVISNDDLTTLAEADADKAQRHSKKDYAEWTRS